MIKIVKPDAPANLLSRGQEQTILDRTQYSLETARYNSGELKFEANSSIYNSDAVREILEAAHHNKCCYCETKDIRSNKDVEHFRPKRAYSHTLKGTSNYPGYFWLAYDWDNLFLACQVCNQIFKNDFFPINDEVTRAQANNLSIANEQPKILHPSLDEPELEIGYRESIPYGITEKGATTIDYLGFGKIDEDRKYSKKQKSRLKLLIEGREQFYKDMELIYKTILIFEAKEVLTNEENELLEAAKNRILLAQNVSSEWSSMIKCAVNNEFNQF